MAAALSIEETVSALVKESFGAAVIESVTVERDSDLDGDPVFRITVVFDSEAGAFDAHKMASLARHVRPRLLERNSTEFPLFRFVSKKDNARLKREAA